MSTDSTPSIESSQNHQDYPILLDAIPDLILRLNREGICLDFRLPQSFRAYGADIDWRGKFLWKFMPPDLAQRRMRYIERAIATNEIQVYEQRIEVDGRLRYEEVRVIRCSEQEALVIVRDISDRKYAEEALKRSEARFQKLAANIPGVLYQFRLAPDGTPSFPYVSAFSQQVWELEPELICQDASLVLRQIHPDERAEFTRSVQRSAETLQPWEWRGRIIPPSGKVKWIQAHAKPERQMDGAILWDGILMDVSDRVQSEAERKWAELAIAESEARFRSFVENANDLIFACSPTGIFTYVSPQVAEISGFLAKELLGQPFSEFIHPDDLPIVRASMTRLLKTGERQTEIEFRAKRKDGSWYWSLCNSAAIQGSNGRIISMLGIARDVTIRKENEAQLRQQAIDLENALQELQKAQAKLIHSEKMSSLGRLVAGIAHEINNPISFIHGNISHATTYFRDLSALIGLYQKHYPQTSPEIEKFIREIELDFICTDLPSLFNSMHTGTERIREIVLSLRNFSRLDEAESKIVNLHDGIESTLTILQSRLHQNGQKITVQKFYSQLPEIECFASSLNQVFLQILTNAIDALAPDSNSPTIEIHTELLNANWVRVRIIDNGLGIPESIQARIFDPFFTTKSVGKGIGMGLATSYQIVTEQHRGILRCRSQVNQGSEFTIDLPIQSHKKGC